MQRRGKGSRAPLPPILTSGYVTKPGYTYVYMLAGVLCHIGKSLQLRYAFSPLAKASRVYICSSDMVKPQCSVIFLMCVVQYIRLFNLST